MKFKTLLAILFELLQKRRLTASYLSEKYEISPRTAYRYVELLAEHVPVFIKRGRNGGVCLADSYKLPVGFLTEDEYQATVEALALTYAQNPEERFLNARRKLSASFKEEQRNAALTGDIGDILILDESALSDTLPPIQEALRDKTVLEITLTGERKNVQKIEPHTLVLLGGEWHLFAFCHVKRGFERFPVKDIRSVLKTEQTFHKRPFEKEDVLALP